jgi:putative ABC transport system permease protein
MLGYYVELAVRSLRRNVVLTTLMIAAIGVGIGASMTSLTILRAMVADPIPEKSAQLFIPQIDVWGPQTRGGDPAADFYLLPELTYRDATALMLARRGLRQSAMYAVRMDVSTPGARPFAMHGRAVYADFFKMFDVPFHAGSPWGSAEDKGRARVAILGAKLAQRLFPKGNALGSTLTLNEREYRIVGVLNPWNPTPQFYNVELGAYSDGEQLFIPFSTAIDRQVQLDGWNECQNPPGPGWFGYLNSECVWVGFWVELPTAAMARDYKQFLYNYAVEQQRLGRFHWPALVQLPDVRQFLVRMHVLPDEVRVSTMVACGFLLVCLINVVGLMLAKFTGRSGEIGVRRAMGATRSDIFLQCLIETGVVGAVGGVLGLVLTVLGLAADRTIVDAGVQRLAHLDEVAVAVTLVLAVCATLCSGLYPTWRASRVQPALQLKTQ